MKLCENCVISGITVCYDRTCCNLTKLGKQDLEMCWKTCDITLHRYAAVPFTRKCPSEIIQTLN